MAVSHLYRINGGQVLGATVDDPASVWVGFLSDPVQSLYYAAVTDATVTATEGNPYVVYAGGVVRDATQPEIDSFPTYEAADYNLIARAIASTVMESSVIERKKWKAMLAVILDEINILRNLHSLPERTLSQGKTAFVNKVDVGGEID